MNLKASNVFLTKTYSIAKIGEVDMAQVMGATTLQRPHAATFAYSAPELILHGPCNEKVRALVSTAEGTRTQHTVACLGVMFNCAIDLQR